MSIEFSDIEDPIIRLTIKNIKEHFKTKRKFTDIAKLQNTCPNAVAKRFENYELASPTYYLKEMRKELAKTLVTEGKLPLSEVAKTLGYEKSINFYVWYESVFGERPIKVRARMGLKSRTPSLGIIDAIVKSMAENIDLHPYLYKDISSLFDAEKYSVCYIKRKFIELYGMTPRAYLLDKQLEYVAEQIRTHGYKESRLIEMTFHNAPTGLNKAFKLKYGMTTSEYGESLSIGTWAKVHGENIWILPSFMDEIIDNITENLLEDRTNLDDLRKFYGVNTQSWEKIFNLYTGMLPSKARYHIRLELVVYFLRNTRWKFSKIMSKIGLVYESDVRNQLTGNYGLTPVQIRKHQGNIPRRHNSAQFLRFVKANADLCIREDDIRLGKIRVEEPCTL